MARGERAKGEAQSAKGEEQGVPLAPSPSLLAEAMKALGVIEKDLLASHVHPDGRVVLVTTAGQKLHWQREKKA